MKFPEDMLMPDEEICCQARMHWGRLVLVPSVMLIGVICAAAYMFMAARDGSMPFSGPVGIAILFLFFAFIAFIAELFSGLSSYYKKLVVTSARILFQSGIIGLRTQERHLEQIEDVSISQGLTDRVFSTGSVGFSGIGGNYIGVRGVSNPSELRRVALQAREKVLGDGQIIIPKVTQG